MGVVGEWWMLHMFCVGGCREWKGNVSRWVL